MTPRDFAYWLQGYFELKASNWEELDIDNSAWRNCVSQHLDLVKATPGSYDDRLVQFIGWMESAIEFEASADKIQAKLNSIFEHVIDPQTPGDQAQLNQIHGGWGETTVRC